MNKKTMLQTVIADYRANRDRYTLIELHRDDGHKSGIGNKDIIRKLVDALIAEAERQLAE